MHTTFTKTGLDIMASEFWKPVDLDMERETHFLFASYSEEGFDWDFWVGYWSDGDFFASPDFRKIPERNNPLFYANKDFLYSMPASFSKGMKNEWKNK